MERKGFGNATESEVREILCAYFTEWNRIEAKIQKRLELDGFNLSQNNLEPDKRKVAMYDRMSAIIAHRLMLDRRDVLLLSRRDYEDLVALAISESLKDGDKDELYEVAMKASLGTINITTEGMADVAQLMVPYNEDLYDEYYRLVSTIIELSDKHSLPPAVFISVSRGYDEIIRHLFTEEQFEYTLKWLLKEYFNPELFLKAINPILDLSMEGVPESERLELRQFIDSSLLPLLNDVKQSIEKLVKDEVVRIF